MMSRLGLEAMMSRLGLGRFGPRSSSEINNGNDDATFSKKHVRQGYSLSIFGTFQTIKFSRHNYALALGSLL